MSAAPAKWTYRGVRMSRRPYAVVAYTIKADADKTYFHSR